MRTTFEPIAYIQREGGQYRSKISGAHLLDAAYTLGIIAGSRQSDGPSPRLHVNDANPMGGADEPDGENDPEWYPLVGLERLTRIWRDAEIDAAHAE